MTGGVIYLKGQFTTLHLKQTLWNLAMRPIHVVQLKRMFHCPLYSKECSIALCVVNTQNYRLLLTENRSYHLNIDKTWKTQTSYVRNILIIFSEIV